MFLPTRAHAHAPAINSCPAYKNPTDYFMSVITRDEAAADTLATAYAKLRPALLAAAADEGRATAAQLGLAATAGGGWSTYSSAGGLDGGGSALAATKVAATAAAAAAGANAAGAAAAGAATAEFGVPAGAMALDVDAGAVVEVAAGGGSEPAAPLVPTWFQVRGGVGVGVGVLGVGVGGGVGVGVGVGVACGLPPASTRPQRTLPLLVFMATGTRLTQHRRHYSCRYSYSTCSSLPFAIHTNTHTRTNTRTHTHTPLQTRTQVSVLMARVWRTWIRSPVMLASELVQYVFVALFIGLM